MVPGTTNEMTHAEYQEFCDKFDISFETGVELNSRLDTLQIFLEFDYLRIKDQCPWFHTIKAEINLYVPFNYHGRHKRIWTVHLL